MNASFGLSAYCTGSLTVRPLPWPIVWRLVVLVVVIVVVTHGGTLVVEFLPQ